MSGGISIPVGFWALWGKIDNAQAFLTLAFIGLLSTVFSLAIRLSSLEHRLRPKLKLTCNGEDGTFCPTYNASGTRMIYYRSRIEAISGESVEDCTAHLIEMHFNGNKVPLNEVLQLTISPGMKSKTIKPGVPDFIDVLVAIKTYAPRFAVAITPNSIQQETLFQKHGKYMLKVAVAGKPGVAAIEAFEFEWKGDVESSRLQLIKPQSPTSVKEETPTSPNS